MVSASQFGVIAVESDGDYALRSIRDSFAIASVSLLYRYQIPSF